MATSLAEQLKKLKLPQTSLLLHEKKRASLLFDPKEAANLDRETVYELGIAGIDELKTFNPRFGDFENTLFSLLSKSLERSVESPQANEKLDQHIQRFLLMLSPYFLLKPSHKALEWLIYRFHIHQFNVDDLMMLILPYHESLMFVRVIQLFDLKDPSNKWHWLHPLQKPGVPLSKTALLNHCASDIAFLNFVCEMTLKAVKIHKDNAGVLSTLFAFTCTTVVGALECKKSVSDVQVMHILKILLKALHSPVVDFAASAFMITAQLARKSLLSEKLLMSIIIKVSKNPNACLTGEVVLLLLQLYQFQNESINIFPRKALINIAKRKDFPDVLGKLATAGGLVTPLLVPLLSQTLSTIQEEPLHSEELKQFINALFTHVRLDGESDEIITVIQTIVDTYDKNEINRQELNNESLMELYSNLLGMLEKQYPNKFDAAMRKLMTNTRTSDKCKDLLQFMPHVALRQGNTLLFEKINHPSPEIRMKGIMFMAEKCTEIEEVDKELLVSSVSERLQDDNARVVKAVLDNFDTSFFMSTLGPDCFLKQLTQLAKKCWMSKGDWAKIAIDVVQMICSEEVVNSVENDNCIIIATFPFLFPGDGVEAEISRHILSSHFGKHNKLLMSIKSGVSNIEKLDHSQICTRSFKSLVNCHKIAGMSDYLQEAAQIVVPEKADVVEKLLVLLFKTSAITKQITPLQSKKLLDEAVMFVESSKVLLAGDGRALCSNNIYKCFKTARNRKLPLEAFLHCVSVLIKYTAIPAKLKRSAWWDLKGVRDEEDTVTAAKFLIRLFEVLVAGSSLQPQEDPTKCAYIIQLKEFFQEYFPQFTNQMNFLSNVWIGHILTEPNEVQPSIVNYELQLRSLCLATSLLRQSESSISWMLRRSEITIPALLIALTCPVSLIRVASLDCLSVLGLSIGGALHENSYIHLVEELLVRKEEFILDAEQLSVVMYVLLSTDPEARTLVKPSNRPHMNGILDALLSCAVSEETPTYVSAALLRILANVTSKNVFMKLMPLGTRVLKSGEKDGGKLNQYSSSILRSIVSRLDEETTECLKNTECFEFFEEVLVDQKTHVYNEDGKIVCPSILAMEQISKEFFDSVPELQQHLLGIILDLGYETDTPGVISAMAHLWKRITVDARLIVVELEKMYNAKLTMPPVTNTRRRGRSAKTAPSLELLKTSPWKRGITLLELIQNKKKLYSVQHLLPILFGILQRCLEFDEQAPVEYTKQLVLSCILNCCQKMSADTVPTNITEESINVALLVQCIRGTQNPQTHHHALLVLSQAAEMIPEQVLHNIMAIFTFMGSSVLRQDDAYSFQVISKIVETVIPLLIRAEHSGVLTEKMNSQLQDVVGKVLRVFVDAMLDIPEHRRISLFHKLLQTLNAEKFLWLFMCLVLESHVIKGNDGEDNRLNKKGTDQKEQTIMPKRLEFLMNVTKQFPPNIVIKNCISVVRYVRSLPSSKESFLSAKKMGYSLPLSSLFDPELHTDKQLRHYRYSLVTFLSSLLSSASFVTEVAALNDEETNKLENLYKDFIENVLCLIHSSSREAELSSGKVTAKYWKVKLNQCYDILDKINALLPASMFLLVIQGLLNNEMATIRRKALDLLNARLQYQTSFVLSCKTEQLLSMLAPLMNIIKGISAQNAHSQEDEMIQQTAILSLKLLTRVLGSEHINEFRKILDIVITIVKSDPPSNNVLASVLLCLAELCSTLRANAISFLPKFMPSVIKILQKQNDVKSADVVVLAVVTAVHKIVESLSNFLSPYLDKVLLEICKISARWHDDVENQKAVPVAQKLKSIRLKISTAVPPRILVPSVSKCYSRLLAGNEMDALGPLTSVLSDSFSAMSTSEMQHQLSDLTTFFLTALQFRTDNEDRPEAEVSVAEGHIVNALVTLVLKLSESSFRPLYYNLFHWATATDSHKDRIITFYRVSSSIAECLKGLFVLFAGHFIKNAADLLHENNVTKTEVLYFGSGKQSEQKSQLLLEYILKTLHSVFLCDSQNFTNKERFETLMQHIVDQMENTLGGIEALQIRSKDFLVPCIAQFAVAAADDTLWKQLNYQILLKTRHNVPQIRLIALETLCEMARKLGEDFLPLLPETVPFLAELLEDEDETVEKACSKTVQELEEILGEPLQKYF